MKNPSITIEMALAAGFSHAGYWDLQQAQFLPEVRDMCAQNKCGKYGTSWVCPPGCGTLEEITAWIRDFDYGMLLQQTGEMQNSFDMAAIDATQNLCSANLTKFEAQLIAQKKNIRTLQTGVCTKCDACTYPDAPCRFPDRLAPSMEACGILVSQECTNAGLGYYYGPKTMTFTVALLVKEDDE